MYCNTMFEVELLCGRGARALVPMANPSPNVSTSWLVLLKEAQSVATNRFFLPKPLFDI